MKSTADGGRRLLTAILVLAAAVRLAHWWTVRDAPFVGQLVMDSREYDSWARQILAGPWLGTGAFFQAPLYPYLIALIYAVSGASLDAVYVLQIAVSVGALWAVYRTGTLLSSPRLGLVAAALGALYGPMVFHDVQLLKESFAASAMAFLLLALVTARDRASGVPWVLAGIAVGVAAGLRENAILLLPWLLLVAWLSREREPGFRRSALALVAGMVLAMAPFAIRNWIVTGEPLPTAFNGGLNVYIGNNPEADGTYRPLVPGRQIPELERRESVRLAEEALGRELAPGEVSRYWLGRSLAWARDEPRDFLALQVRKLGLFWSFYEWPDAVDYYWVRRHSPALRLAFVELGALVLLAGCGLVLERRRWRRWIPVLAVIGGWTAATVPFFVFSRFRIPMVPALLLLAAVPVERTISRLRRDGGRPALVAGLGVTAAFLVPHLLGFGPRVDLAEYNLGRLARERGEPDRAREHFRRALEANPEQVSALVELGADAARRGDLETARTLFERGVELAPDSIELWTNLGAAHFAQGDLDAAAEALERAIALDPDAAQALHNLSLVRLRQGRMDEARELNRRVLELVPGQPEAERLKERLRGGA